MPWKGTFWINTVCPDTGFGITGLTIMRLRALRQRTADGSRSDGWECRTVRNTRTGRWTRDGSTRELQKHLAPEEKTASRYEQDACPAYQAYISGIRKNHFRAVLAEELILEYREGRFEMRFTDQNRNSVSAGRGLRYAEMGNVENVRILTDVSSVEVFINDGQYVFTTRYYPGRFCLSVEAEGADIAISRID